MAGRLQLMSPKGGKHILAQITNLRLHAWALAFAVCLSTAAAQTAVYREKPAWAKGDFWAPEIVSGFGRTFVFYTARRDEGPGRRGTLCVAAASAAAPQGPY